MSDDTSDEVRRRLADVRDVLAQQVFIPEDSAAWAVSAIERFLAGESQTLDDAFGLTRSPGRPLATARLLSRARQVEALREQGLTWAQVIDELGANGVTFDEKELRKLLNRFEVELIADKITKRLSEKNDRG